MFLCVCGKACKAPGMGHGESVIGRNWPTPEQRLIQAKSFQSPSSFWNVLVRLSNIVLFLWFSCPFRLSPGFSFLQLSFSHHVFHRPLLLQPAWLCSLWVCYLLFSWGRSLFNHLLFLFFLCGLLLLASFFLYGVLDKALLASLLSSLLLFFVFCPRKEKGRSEENLLKASSLFLDPFY